MLFLQNKKLGRNGSINLPKKWRAELGLHCGDIAYVRFHQNVIWISSFSDKNNDNIMSISPKGSVTIPAEIRKLLNLYIESELDLYINQAEKSFVLIPSMLKQQGINKMRYTLVQ